MNKSFPSVPEGFSDVPEGFNEKTQEFHEPTPKGPYKHMTDRERISVTFGEELFSPTNFQHFKVGPFTYETTQYIGETTKQAWARAWKVVNDQADTVFLAKRNKFFAHMEALQK